MIMPFAANITAKGLISSAEKTILSGLMPFPLTLGGSSGPAISGAYSGADVIAFNNPFSVAGQGGRANSTASTEGSQPRSEFAPVASNSQMVIILALLAVAAIVAIKG